MANRASELEQAGRFLELLQHLTGKAYEVEEHRDAPDFIIRSANGAKTWLEVGFVFSSQAEADWIFNDDPRSLSLRNSNDLFVQAILQTRNRKYRTNNTLAWPSN